MITLAIIGLYLFVFWLISCMIMNMLKVPLKFIGRHTIKFINNHKKLATVITVIALFIAVVASVWLFAPAMGVFDGIEDADFVEIYHGVYEEDGIQYEEKSVSCDDEAIVSKMVDNVNWIKYKNMRTSTIPLSEEVHVYKLSFKEDGDSIGEIIIYGDRYLSVSDAKGKSKLYEVYSYEDGEAGKYITSSDITQYYYGALKDTTYENVWEDFVGDLKHCFTYKDGNVIFTMPQEPDMKYETFSIQIQLAVEYDDAQRKSIEMYKSGTLNKIPTGEVHTYDVSDVNLLWISVNVMTDEYSAKEDIRNIPDNY